MKPFSCVACDSSDFIAIPTLRPNLQLFECKQCGVSHTYPRPKPAELEKQYTETYYGPENVKFLHTFEKLISSVSRWRALRIHQMIKPHSRILEIGCGRGLLLKYLAQHGHECYGTERSELAARRARKTVGLRIHSTPLHQCGFDSNMFDLVILWHVLEHLDHPEECLRDVNSILKPRGVLLLEIPNYASLQSQITGKHWFHLDLDHHLYHFSREGIRKLLHKTQFHVLHQSTFSWDQCPYGVLQSILNCLGIPTDLLYQVLKNEIGLPKSKKAVQFLLAGVLAPIAFTLSFLEALLGKGGVIRIAAESRKSVP